MYSLGAGHGAEGWPNMSLLACCSPSLAEIEPPQQAPKKQVAISMLGVIRKAMENETANTVWICDVATGGIVRSNAVATFQGGNC